MKRFFSALIIAIFITIFTVSASAAGIALSVVPGENADESLTGIDIAGKISLTVPSGYGFDDVKGLLYFGDYTEQMIISAEETSFDSFMFLFDGELSNVGASFAQAGKDRGITGSEICEFGGKKFIKLIYDEGSVYKCEYVVIHNGIKLSIKWLADSKTVSDAMILEGLVFANYDMASSIPSSLYRQEQSGIAFNVPENWQLISTDEMNDYLYTAVFRPVGRSSVELEYACRNMYAASGATVTPEEYTDSLNVKGEIINIIGLEGSDINTETIGQMSYVYGVVELKEELNDAASEIKIAMDRIYMISFSEGFVHIFNFSAPEGNEYYAKVHDLVGSTHYPGKVSNLVGIPRKADKTPNVTHTVVEQVIPGESGGKLPIGLIAAIIGVVAVAIIAVAVVMLRNNKKLPEPAIPENNAGIPENKNIFNINPNMQNNPNIIFCRTCNGSVNIMFDKNCPHCGALIPESKVGTSEAEEAAAINVGTPSAGAGSDGAEDVKAQQETSETADVEQ